MSTKQPFLTHDIRNVGKKSNNLPMRGATCNQNSCFGYTLQNNGKLIVESGKWKTA